MRTKPLFLASFAAACLVAYEPAILMRGDDATKSDATVRPPLTADEEMAVAPYLKMPETIKALVTNVRKFNLKVNGGINYNDFHHDFHAIQPDVALFAESEQAKGFSLLAVLLTNACDCYGNLDSLWNLSIFGDKPEGARIVMGYYKRHLLAVAELNILAARTLASGDGRQIADVLKSISINREKFTLKFAEKLAKQDMDNDTQQEGSENARARDEKSAAETIAREDRIAAAKKARDKREQQKTAEEATRWREWTKADGTAIGRARYMWVASGNVRLKKDDGTLVTVAHDELSEADQKWLADRAKHR